jgi:hypothetical protein
MCCLLSFLKWTISVRSNQKMDNAILAANLIFFFSPLFVVYLVTKRYINRQCVLVKFFCDWFYNVSLHKTTTQYNKQRAY